MGKEFGTSHSVCCVSVFPAGAVSVKTMVVDAFAQGRRLLDVGQSGPSVLEHIVHALRRGLSRATPAVVMPSLQNLVVRPGTPSSSHMAELRPLVANVRCVGQIAPADGTVQSTETTNSNDRFPGLEAQVFAGRNLRPVPVSCVDELMAALEDLALHQTAAIASARLRVAGVHTAQRCPAAAPSRRSGEG